MNLAPPLRAAGWHDWLRQAVEVHCGLRVADDQMTHLEAAVSRVLPTTPFATAGALCDAIETGGRVDLLRALAVELTIGETHFFRVAPQVAALRQMVLPDVVQRRSGVRRLRLWSAGCSTGEEPYTLAALLHEQGVAAGDWDVEVIATDLSPQSLATAREGLYGEWSFRDTPAEMRERYFRPEGQRWRLGETLRHLVRFEQHNLTADPIPGPGSGGFDLVLCRNVTIYFGQDTAQAVYRRLAQALAPGGWLILGPSDPPPAADGPVAPVFVDGAVLWRAAATRPRVALAAPAATAGARTAAVAARPLTPGPRAAASRAPVQPAAVTQRAAGGGRSTPASPAAKSQPGAPAPQPAAQQDRQTARQHAERSVAAQPLDGERHLALGLLYLEEGSVQPALDTLRRAAFLDASNPLAHFGLGRAHRLLGQHGLARASMVHSRRLVAPLADDAPVPGASDLRAAELRLAIDASLAELNAAAG